MVGMRYLLGALVALWPITLAVLALRGRAEVRSCCAAEPTQDLRMREALADAASRPTT